MSTCPVRIALFLLALARGTIPPDVIAAALRSLDTWAAAERC